MTGSSPLARGTSRLGTARSAGGRLIPARAGNIRGTPAYLIHAPAHPRSRGEHKNTRAADFYINGSSPLARGTYILVAHQVSFHRLIPARAGNILLRQLPYG